MKKSIIWIVLVNRSQMKLMISPYLDKVDTLDDVDIDDDVETELDVDTIEKIAYDYYLIFLNSSLMIKKLFKG